MCGIAGIITPDPREAETVLGRMVPAMRHRGPDDDGHEILPFRGTSGPEVVGLGFRRLAILDLSPTGHQPMRNPESGDVLIFNGEIYNFRQLRAELQSTGCRFRGTSDSEVLLHALGRWGDAALERVEGMFALAFYRARDQGLLLARDPLGIKPLYVAHASGRLVFASEVRTVLASQIVSRDIDAAGIAGMLAFGSVQEPRTVFSMIEEFPAGRAQWIGKPSRHFWQFPAVDTRTGDDTVATTRQFVHDAVRRHLVADVPVGVFLSAGIDSTIVAACAAEAAASVTAFTVGIGARQPDDETAVAADTARRLGIRHEILEIVDGELPMLWHDWVDSLDSPSIDGFNTYLVTKGLADRGIKVGLSGLGADELFGGYPVFRRAPRIRRLMAALSFLPASVAGGIVEVGLLGLGRPAVAEKLGDIVRGGRDLASIAVAMRRVIPDTALRAIGAATGTEGLTSPSVGMSKDAPAHDDFNVISRVELSHYMRNTLLRDSDANSMRHSLELRVPYLDLPLVSHALAMPGVSKAPPMQPAKHLLRRAFADRLPETVTRRRKTGFTLPIDRWMRGDMRGFCEAALAALDTVPFLDVASVRQLWHRYIARRASTPWTHPLALVALGAYLRRNMIQS